MNLREHFMEFARRIGWGVPPVIALPPPPDTSALKAAIRREQALAQARLDLLEAQGASMANNAEHQQEIARARQRVNTLATIIAEERLAVLDLRYGVMAHTDDEEPAP